MQTYLYEINENADGTVDEREAVEHPGHLALDCTFCGNPVDWDDSDAEFNTPVGDFHRVCRVEFEQAWNS